MRAEDVSWLLKCEPRAIQLEATLRSVYGYRNRNRLEDKPKVVALPHKGAPAFGWGHFMEMRTGKTPTILNEIEVLSAHGVKNALILAPNRFKTTWVSEAVKFGSSRPALAFESSSRWQADRFIRREPGGILVVNYEALIHPDTFKLLERWVKSHTYVAADESVNLKNRTTARFRNAMKLVKRAKFRRVATGLPTPQGPHDLWSQLRFAGHLEGVPFHGFRARWVKMGGWRGKQVVGARNPNELSKKLARISFQARRGDWSDKFDCDYETMELELPPRVKSAYLQMERDMMVYIAENEWVTVEMVISKIVKLQQICSGFLLNDGDVHPLLPFVNTPKFKDLKDRLENMVQGKAIVVAHFRHTVDQLFKHLSEFNPAKIAGGRSISDDPQVAAQKFNNDPSCRVLVAQGQAVKYGHTLMGSPLDPCHTIVFYENSYSLDTRAQCEERPQGVGQTAPIHVLDYVSSEIERRVIHALQRKREVAEVIMGYVKSRVTRRGESSG